MPVSEAALGELGGLDGVEADGVAEPVGVAGDASSCSLGVAFDNRVKSLRSRPPVKYPANGTLTNRRENARARRAGRAVSHHTPDHVRGHHRRHFK